MSLIVRGGCVAFLLLSAGCALTSKSDSIVLRYFTPERVASPGGRATQGPAANSNLQLRLGRVNAASYLRDKIAFRDSDYEVGYYDDWRWTEKPESYLRRAAGRALFEEQGIHQVVSGPGPTLEIVLNAFEELRAPRHVARVEVTWSLRDDRAVLAQKTLVIERPVAQAKGEGQPGAVAVAMADALNEVTGAMVTSVVSELARAPVSSPEPAAATGPL